MKTSLFLSQLRKAWQASASVNIYGAHKLCASFPENLDSNLHKSLVKLTPTTTYLIISEEKIEGQRRGEVSSQEVVSPSLPSPLCRLLLLPVMATSPSQPHTQGGRWGWEFILMFILQLPKPTILSLPLSSPSVVLPTPQAGFSHKYLVILQKSESMPFLFRHWQSFLRTHWVTGTVLGASNSKMTTKSHNHITPVFPESRET